MSEADEIKDVRAREQRSKPETLTPRQRARVLAALGKALEKRDRAFYEGIITNELKIAPGSERYVQAMKIWDDLYED